MNECVTWHKGTRKKEGKNADEKRQAETQETKQKGGDRWEIEGERSKKTNKKTTICWCECNNSSVLFRVIVKDHCATDRQGNTMEVESSLHGDHINTHMHT